MPLDIACVIGTRPDAIKMAPVVKQLRAHAADVRATVIVSGQHREMLDQVLTLFDIVPDYDLNAMQPDQTLADLTVTMLSRLDPLLADLSAHGRANVLLVHGDTPTAFVAALAAYYRRIPVGHVEAGLRTYDIDNPYPEEFNRQAVDSLSRWLFAPTATARQHLLAEGKPAASVTVTGNTVIDALLDVAARVGPWQDRSLLRVDFGQRVILFTAHRRENLGEDLAEMFAALRELVDSFPDVEVVFPVHLNPRVRVPAERILGQHRRIHLLAPLSYQDNIGVMKRAHLVLTDSGGLQEEAPALNKPVLIMRRSTERPEGIAVGVARLVGVERRSIVQGVSAVLNDPALYQRMTKAPSPYGDGLAAQRIVQTLLHAHGLAQRPEDFALDGAAAAPPGQRS